MNLVPMVLSLKKQSVYPPVDGNVTASSKEISIYEMQQQELLNTVHPSDSSESLVSCHFRKPCLISLYQHKSIVIVLFQMSVEVISEYGQRYKCGSVFTSVCPSKQAMLSASGFILLLKCITIARAVTGGVLRLGVQLPLFLLSIMLWHSILPASITLNWMHLILEDKEVQNRHTTEKK